MAPELLISTQHIFKTYGNTVLFQDLSLTVHAGDRLGLVGPNGSGKSTLLKILADLEQADHGQVAKARHKHISYLAQIDNFPPESTIRQVLLDHLPDHLADWEIQKRLSDLEEQLQFANLDQQVATLSGGWRKRVALAAKLAEACDLLLLDEPTNHLDLEGILWLENFLQQAPFSFILISHDRFFLEHTCTSTMELDQRYKTGFLKVRSSYSRFILDREKILQEQKTEELAISNQVRRETEWLRRGPKARTSKAQYRIDRAHAMISELDELQQRNSINDQADLVFSASTRRSKRLLQAQGLQMSRGNRLLFAGLDIFLSPGTKLGIMGSNGSGKSTLVELLKGQLDPAAGKLFKAPGLQIVTLDQNRRLPDETTSLRRALAPDGDLVVYQDNPLHITTWAKKFLFTREQLDLPVSRLSGGERARVLLARIILETTDVLILDEPTNDLDIPTLEVLEQSLIEFQGAVVLITHDRYLMDRVCEEIIFLPGNGEVKVFADTFQLIRWQQEQIPQPTQDKVPQAGGHKLQREQLKELRKSLAKTEREIEKLEAQIATHAGELLLPEYATDPARLSEISNKIHALELKLESRMEQWESLELKLGELASL